MSVNDGEGMTAQFLLHLEQTGEHAKTNTKDLA